MSNSNKKYMTDSAVINLNHFLTHWLLCCPSPAVTSLGLYSTSDVITFDQKLPSFILNFCRTKRSFWWYPDQSDWPNGAWSMHKNAQKLEWKTQSKISCNYMWLLCGKNCPSQWYSLRIFWTGREPSRRSITAAKRKEKEKKGRRKKITKIEKPEDVGHFLVQKLKISKFWFLRMPEQKCRKTWC